MDFSTAVSYSDTVPPTVTVNPLVTTDVNPTITGTVSESNVVVQVTVADGTYNAVVNNGDLTWSANVTDALDPGEYTIHVWALDGAGNAGYGSDTLTIE